MDLSSGSDQRTFFYWNQINMFLLSQLHKYSRGFKEQERPALDINLGDSQYDYFEDPDYIPPCDKKLKKKKAQTNQMWGDAHQEEQQEDDPEPSQEFNVSDSQLRQWMSTQT